MAKNQKKSTTSKSSSKPKKSSKGKGFKNFWSKLLRFFIIFIIIFFAVSIGSVLFYKWVNPPFTYLMAKRKIVALFQGKPSIIHYDFVEYRNISDYLKVAVIASEDQKFPEHNGFDLVSIAKAMEKNKFSKKVKGASTITQQVAKNVFLWDGRNFVRKSLEAYFTFLIEIIWGKRRILEVYLNIAEMGPMTFGAEEASRRYFEKSARKLSPDQAASIAAVLPNPIIFSVKRPTKYTLKKKDWILTQMDNLGGASYIKGLR
jgi:monofunctional biosynthetic peptidoglycan transglycosylase